MPVFTDEQLHKSVRAGQILPLYFLYGEEAHLMQTVVDLLLKKVVVPGLEGFNLQQFDGTQMDFNQFQTAYEALPMMAEYKCVTVKDWNLEKLSKNDLEALTALLSDPNPNTVLILFSPSLSLDVKKSTKLKKICDIIGKNGAICNFGWKEKQSLKKMLSDRCARRNISISPTVCEKIIEVCGPSLSVLSNELDKLIFYVGENGEITKETVSLLCTESVQNTAFDLSNAILLRQYGKAFSILDNLFYLRVEPMMILGALNMSFLDLYRLKAAQISLKSTDEVAKDFHYRSKYRLTKLYQNVSQFSIEQIRGCIRSLEKTDRLLKSSRADSRILLEQMLGEMICVSLPSQKTPL